MTERLVRRQHRPVATATLIVLFWLVAALVAAVHAEVEPVSRTGGAIAAVAVLLATA